MCSPAFTVAQHMMWVARMVKREDRIHALLHDAHEAYLSDIPKPLKESFPSLLEAADKIDVCIYQNLGIEMPDAAAKQRVHEADEYSAWIESRTLFSGIEQWNPGKRPPDDLEAAHDMFKELSRHEIYNPFIIREEFMNSMAYALL